MDRNRSDPCSTNVIPSSLYSATDPSASSFRTSNRLSRIRPLKTIPSLAFLSSMLRAAIFSRGLVTGSSMIVPFCLVITLTVSSRAMLTRMSTMSWTAKPFSLNALSMDPGRKKEHSPSLPPTTSS